MSSPESRKWYVIQTKPRFEKKVAQQIENKRIEVFLPLITTIRQWSDRKKKIQIPMFSGYLFIHGTEKERVEAISNTLGALRYIFYDNRPAVVSDVELNNIKLSLQAPERVSIENKNVGKGDLVKVTSGVFRGMEGVISEIRGKYQLTLNLTELSVSMNIVLNSGEVELLKKVN